MPQQHASGSAGRRLVRLGSAGTAVSAGALVLLIAGAPAADAAQECKKGTDPASTLENWKCQLDNIRKELEPKPAPTPTPKPNPGPTKPADDGESRTDPVKEKPKPKPKPVTGGGSGGGGALPPASGPSAMSGPEGLRPYSGATPSTAPGLPGVLPTPEVAGPNAAPASGGGAVVPQTRLIAPVAATRHENGEMLWVAAAAAAAGAVGALHLSVLGRRVRTVRRR
ncbi:hypothetical protein [Spirillospora albida]|uniref:hypothetical protein n=1 Tax=Spirillospora albida TaxID=58123 RepID=UPI0004BFEBDE|nr:hypothetical protein [Spirillospora albida]